MPASSSEDARLTPKYERWGAFSDDYRNIATKMVSFQVLAEIVGVLQFAEWLPRVPDFNRKRMLTAKIQDEVGHGHVTARVAEDLGTSREAIIRDWLDGKTKLLNIFHYGFHSWEELGTAALVVNSAAIVQFKSLDKGTYLPYARALKKIEKEEAFHYHHARDLTHEIHTCGTKVQRQRSQDAFETWLGRTLVYFGPPDLDTVEENPAYRLGLKVDANETLRQHYLERMVPVWKSVGLEVDHLVTYDEDADAWDYGAVVIDWAAEKEMLREGGPRYEDWKTWIRSSFEKNGRYFEPSVKAAA